jgi:hypothetical protein
MTVTSNTDIPDLRKFAGNPSRAILIVARSDELPSLIE